MNVNVGDSDDKHYQYSSENVPERVSPLCQTRRLCVVGQPSGDSRQQVSYGGFFPSVPGVESRLLYDEAK